MTESTTNLELKWQGHLLLQGGSAVVKITEHRRWWSVQGRAGTFNLSKKDFPTLDEVKFKVGSNLLEQALTLKNQQTRNSAVLTLRALMNRG